MLFPRADERITDGVHSRVACLCGSSLSYIPAYTTNHPLNEEGGTNHQPTNKHPPAAASIWIYDVYTLLLLQALCSMFYASLASASAGVQYVSIYMYMDGCSRQTVEQVLGGTDTGTVTDCDRRVLVDPSIHPTRTHLPPYPLSYAYMIIHA